MKYVRLNLRPLMLVLFCTCVGFFFGGAFTGFMVGMMIVAAATLFF